MNIILIPIFLPLFTAFFVLLTSERSKYVKEIITIAATFIALLASIAMFNTPLNFSMPWAGYGFDFTLRIDGLSAFLLIAASAFSFLIALYSFSFMKRKSASVKWFNFNLLITQTFSAGVILSDNLLLLLFFWEGLLIFLYSFIALSNENRYSKITAMKAFIINAATDLCLVLGIAITGYLAGTMNMSEISSGKLAMHGWAIAGYVLIMIGAISKTGVMPFNTWIPDAGSDSNAHFMAFVPAALDKILGVYLLARASVYLYQLNGSSMQLVLMTIGAITLLFAVLMALIQTDYKKLLSYHAISQAGYMVLGIGTLNPIGIAGGLFHMINNAVYKSCLFLTAGSVERQTKTTDIRKLGGLMRNMPLTGLFFIIAALSISGVAPFNGFFSKELIYKGTLDTGYRIFFLVAEIGSILTLASFLKLGHSVFFGKRPDELKETKEAPFSMLAPMLVLAGICVAFGFGAKLPTDFFLNPALAALGLKSAEPLAGFHFNNLYLISLAVIFVALISHIVGYKISGNKAAKASDHIHYAPVFKQTYTMAEHRFFDLYEQIMKVLPKIGKFFMRTDRFFDFLTDYVPSLAINALSKISQRFHTGSYPLYMTLTIVGFVVYIIFTFNTGGLK